MGETLEVFDGDTADLTIALTDDATAGAPLASVAAAKVWLTVKTHETDPDSAALLSKETGTGISVLDVAAGTVAVHIEADEVKITTRGGSFTPDKAYRYDVRVKAADGRVQTCARGLFVVRTHATHRIV